MFDLVRNPKDRLSHDTAQFLEAEKSVMIMSKCEYRKVPKYLDARKLCCNLPKIQTKSPNLRLFMSPPEGLGDILFFPGRLSVRLSVCPSVCLSRIVSAL